jgi:hypothetical protein
MLLHPVKDGLIPMPHERGMTVRDKGGNRLVDVVDPQTGYCVGTRSPLSVKGKVMKAAPIQGGSGEDVRFDTDSARFYELVRKAPSDPIGFVVRLTTDGDDSLPCTRVRVIQATTSISVRKGRKSTAPYQKPRSVREENDAAAWAVLSAMGYEGEMNPQIRDAALAMIELEKGSIARLVRNAGDESMPSHMVGKRKKSNKSRKSETS